MKIVCFYTLCVKIKEVLEVKFRNEYGVFNSRKEVGYL